MIFLVQFCIVLIVSVFSLIVLIRESVGFPLRIPQYYLVTPF